MKTQVVEERTHWALRVRVLDREGVLGEPFYWPPWGPRAMGFETRAMARRLAHDARADWCHRMGFRKVTATPVRIVVRTTIREVG